MFRSGIRQFVPACTFLIKQRSFISTAVRSSQLLFSRNTTQLLNSKCIFTQKRFINIKKELKEVHCCSGCGIQLQYQNEDEYGYIPKETMIDCIENKKEPICQRCHRLRYSGKIKDDEIPAAIPKEFINKIPFKKHSLILFVCDAMDIPGSIIPHINELVRGKPMVVIMNKCDLLPIDLPSPRVKRWVYSIMKAHHITNIKDIFFVSSLQNYGISNVLNYLNHTPYKHVYVVGMTNSGKSSFLNQCIQFTKSKVKIKNLMSLTTEGIQLNKEAMIADDHFDVDYWEGEEDDIENDREESIEEASTLPKKEELTQFTISALPSTTLGVFAIKLHNARFLLYDTPGVCPSNYRIRLLSTMLAEDQNKVKVLFPRKKIVPTVFSLHPDHSILIGALGQIDYTAFDNDNPLICYSYSPLPLHLCKTMRAQELLLNHAGKLLTPPFTQDQYLTTGGLVFQNEFELKHVFNTPSEIKNTLTPSSPSNLKYTAFMDISLGGFGWIAFFTQGGDNTNKKYKQLMAGKLTLNAVKGFDLYPRPPLLTKIPEKWRKYK